MEQPVSVFEWKNISIVKILAFFKLVQKFNLTAITNVFLIELVIPPLKFMYQKKQAEEKAILKSKIGRICLSDIQAYYRTIIIKITELEKYTNGTK